MFRFTPHYQHTVMLGFGYGEEVTLKSMIQLDADSFQSSSVISEAHTFMYALFTNLSTPCMLYQQSLLNSRHFNNFIQLPGKHEYCKASFKLTGDFNQLISLTGSVLLIIIILLILIPMLFNYCIYLH